MGSCTHDVVNKLYRVLLKVNKNDLLWNSPLSIEAVTFIVQLSLNQLVKERYVHLLLVSPSHWVGIAPKRKDWNPGVLDSFAERALNLSMVNPDDAAHADLGKR